MSILIKIAWRNIWRNPRRSWVLISALAVGVFSFLGAVAYIDGFSIQMIDSAINLGGGHLQISARGYHENPTIRTYLPDVARASSLVPGVRQGGCRSTAYWIGAAGCVCWEARSRIASTVSWACWATLAAISSRGRKNR